MSSTATSTPSDYNILDYLSVVRRRWLWVLVPVLLLVGAAAFYSTRQPDRYQATTTVLLGGSAAQRALDPTSQSAGALSRQLSNEISFARSDPVESLVEEELGLLPAISISTGAGADVLLFTATAGTPIDAATFANTWADKYISVKRDRAVQDVAAATTSLQADLAVLRQERQELTAPLDELKARIERAADPDTAVALQLEYDALAEDLRYELELVGGQAEATVAGLTQLKLQAGFAGVGEAKVIEVAAPPLQRTNAPLSRDLAVGLVVGLMVGFGLALLADTRDKTIKTAADILPITDLPVLASIPWAGRKQQVDLGITTYRNPDGRYADAYHKVRSSIEFASLEGDIRSVLITSPNASEGKSTTSSNLALALSSVGRRTVLVDVDFRRASLHETYQLNQSPGLADVILYGAEIESVAYSIQDDGLENLLVIPTGSVPPSPAAFVGTPGFLDTIDWIGTQADTVILDAPPLLAVSDAHTLGKHVDAVVLTAMARKTTRNELAEVLNVLGQVGARVIGIVLIGVDEVEGYNKHYYYQPRAKTIGAVPGGELWTSSSTKGVEINLDRPGSPITVQQDETRVGGPPAAGI